MKRLLAVSVLATMSLTPAAVAGNTSSNSSSNSSNGVHTRVDTIITDDDNGQSIYVRRTVRTEPRRDRPRYVIRERERSSQRTVRRWYADDDD